MSESGLRSRRALLTGAGAAAAAVAANAVISASPALGAATDPVLLGSPNDGGTAATTVTAGVSAAATLAVTNTSTDLISAGLEGIATSTQGRAIVGLADTTGTGVFAIAGVQATRDDTSNAANWDTSFTAVYGWADAGDNVTTFGSGVWGDSADYGVYGSGGLVGVLGDGGTGGTGLEGYSGIGYGLYVTGKVKFASHSGRLKVAKGRTSISKGVAGMTSGNIVIAVLQTPETGTWVRAAVAAAGKFTVYFNRALPSSSVVGWIVLG